MSWCESRAPAGRGLVLLLAVLAPGCEQPGPTGPRAFPDFDGNWAGTVTVTYSTSPAGFVPESYDSPMTMTVAQSQGGDQLTIFGSIRFLGLITYLPILTGTVNVAGVFTLDGGVAGDVVTDCGRLTTTDVDLAFSGETARVRKDMQTDCGPVVVEGSLEREDG